MVTEESPRPPALAARARSGFTGAAAGCFLLAVAVLTAVYATDTTSMRGVAAYIAICVGAGAATLWGARRYRPIDRAAWYLLALTPLLGCTGMVLRLLLAGVGGTTGSLIPDLVTMPGYLLLIAGLLRLLRVRRGSGAGSALDGGLMAVAALVMTWAILIEPALANAELPGALKVINGVYPTISVAVLFVGALLAMTEVRSILAFWMLALGWVGLLIGDLVYAFASVGTVILPLWAANCAYCTFFGLLGAAGLHPSMVSLSRPAATRVRGYGHSRFVAVAVALVVPAAVVAVGLPNGVTDRAVSAILLSLLGVLVLVRITGAVNSHARSEMLLEHQANHDSLTGLPNRLRLGYHLDEALGRARIAGCGVSVVFMDLDQFKVVNDSWGHETGDELLTVVAARLASTVRQGELVARMGGDEFVIVCEDVDTAAQAVDAGGRLLAVFNDPVALRSAQVPVTSSVGVAFADPSVREVTVEDLLREADTAMYRSKMRGGAAVVLFDESMRKEVAERIALESSLVGALERGELQLFYQPIVDLHSGITTGFEALMRWEHPDLGMVPPSDFIPVAEDTGLILKLGRWAIEHAALQLGEWHREFGDTLSMSVNLSPRQMFDPQLVPTVRRSLEDNRLPGAVLCLEVTESALMENVETTMATIMQLKQLGARLSADDFGTGYSSLAHLRMFPFDEVKVDRSFVAGLGDGGEDDVIVGAVMSMAQALSLATVAEGVETTAQRDRLLELGADHGQGWLFSAPLCARDATKHLFDVHGRAPIKL
jgi:diguanylate cyclase (GGDEF)-like protein